VLTLAAYLVGAVCGLLVRRAGPRLQHDWPLYLRGQLMVTAGAAGVFAAWRLTAPHELVGPLLITAAGFVLVGAAVATRGRVSSGEAGLEAWAAEPNGAFFVLPVAGIFAGPAAVGVAALANALYAFPNAVCTHLMRRDAPHPQRRATTWVDQSSVGALVLGLLLHLAGPAPSWSHLVLNVSGPLLALTGAAVFVGSAVHPHNTAVERHDHGLRRFVWLSALRAACLLPLAFLAPDRPLAVVAVLGALTAPTFSPVQLAVLYGYRSGLVNSAVRWGWVLVPAGLVLAALV
jgi:hypothetical protein